MSLCFGNFGQKHNGKTTRAIKLALAMPCEKIFVNDVQNEAKYKAEKKITRFYGSMDAYIDLIGKTKNGCFIIEEATMFFSHAAGNSAIVGKLLSSRFSGNVFILNFHSLRQYPVYILDYTDYMFVGKSKGNLSHLQKKFEDYPQVWKAWEAGQKSENQYYFKQVRIT